MNRDTLKTLAGLAVIALIVVATFMYGNAQRQAQIKQDQAAKQQQAAKTDDQAKLAQPSASATPAAPGTATPENKQANTNATAPVKTPASNTIQGSGTATPTPAPQASVTPAPAGQVGSAQTAAPAGTGAGAALPEAGSPVIGIIGLAAIVVMGVMLRRSKRAIFAAARTRR